MAKPSSVWRPTENAAVAGTRTPRPSASLNRLYQLLAVAVRRHDRRGAQLLRHLLVRAMATGPVGAV
jgi:hypothetical protein